MQNSEPSAVVADQIKEQYQLASQFYDANFHEKNFVSTLTLIVYLPVGILLMLLRFIVICLLYVCVHVAPSLQNNSVFVRFVSLTLGVFSVCTYYNRQSIAKKSNKIYASNHVTCLDYVAIKCGAIDTSYNENHSFNRSVNNDYSRVSMFFTKILQQNQSVKSNKLNFIYFPESMATNGCHALLRFDFNLFEMPDSSYSCVPVCVRVHRPLFAFSVNYIHSNDLVNTLLSLFLPFTVYKVDFLSEQFVNENETSKQFAERVRVTIASHLKVNRSDLSHEGLRQMFLNYRQHLANEQRQRQHEINRRGQQTASSRRRRDDSVSFADISRVAFQIKDVLPDVSFDTIKHHINVSASLDIDTLIASILDANESNSAHAAAVAYSTSSITSTPQNNQKPSTSSSSTNSSQTNAKSNTKNTYISYEERKFALLNEARQRYLSKHKQ